MSNQEQLVIGLAGLGTVGGGLMEMLRENEADILNRTGRRIRVKTIAVRNLNKTRTLPEGTTLTDDPLSLARDPEIDVVVELMGGKDTARTLIQTALRNGKHVVTANKALLAEHGEEIFALAAERNCFMGYEASVAGAVPIVQTLR